MHGKNAETIKTSDPAHFTSGFLDRHSSKLFMLLAAAMMKFQLEEGKISAAVTVIYLGSAFGGRIAGRRTEKQKIPVGAARRNALFCSAFSSDTDPETEHRSVFHTDDNDSLSVHGRRNVRRNACFLKHFV